MAGNGKQRTNLQTAARAAGMYQAGIPVGDISAETGLSKRTIYHILNGDYNWGEILKNNEAYKLYKEATTKALEVNAWELAKKSFVHAEEKLPDASYAQAVLGGSILLDKARLLAGESTENIAHAHRHEVVAKDEVAARVLASLSNSVQQTPTPIEVQSDQASTDPTKTP